MVQVDYEFTLRVLKREQKLLNKCRARVPTSDWKASLIDCLGDVRNNMKSYYKSYDTEPMDAMIQTLEDWSGSEADFEHYLESKIS